MALEQLGNSDLNITPIGLGTWAIGGDGAFGWGPQEDAQSIEAIRQAVESGINWIDTAPVYGLGHAEEIVATALQDYNPANRPLVFTKCSLIWDARRKARHSLKADTIRKEIEDILERLQIERIDLCQVHWPSFPPGSPTDNIEEAWTTLADLVNQGKIRHIGVSNFNVAEMERVRKIAPITSLQPPYSMLMREIETEILPYCLKNNIGVLAYSPMHNGLLSGSMTRERIAALPRTDWRKQVNPAFREPHLSRNLKLVELLKTIGQKHGRTVGEVAIVWTLRHAAVTAAIVGARSASQVDGFIGAMDFRLDKAEIAQIEAHLPDSISMFQLG